MCENITGKTLYKKLLEQPQYKKPHNPVTDTQVACEIINRKISKYNHYRQIFPQNYQYDLNTLVRESKRFKQINFPL